MRLRRAQEARTARLVVRREGQLVGDRMGEHGRVVARLGDGSADGEERPSQALAAPQHVRAGVALPHRRLAPDEDAGTVEALEQLLVQQVVGARDVRAEVLQVGHDAVHVPAAERRARAGHVLVDRCAAQPDAAVVEVELAAHHGHRAQPDPATLHLDLAAGLHESEPGAVEPGAIGRPELGRRHGKLEADPLERARRVSGSGTGHGPGGHPGARRRTASARGARRRARWLAPLEQCRRSRARRRSPCGPRHSTRDIVPRSRTRESAAGIRWTGRTIPAQFHQPSGSFGSLRPSTTTTSSFAFPGRRPRASSVKGV